jgi:hypothetical protein
MDTHIYKNLEFSKWDPPATAEQIAESEIKLGGTFPDDYREFLRDINGGLILTDPSFLATDHGSEPEVWTLKRLLGIDPCEFWSISSERFAYDFNERVPNLIIPIGILAASYRICLSLRKKDYGHIYMWGPRHLWPFDDDLPNKKNMKDLFFIAKSFTEFLALLKPLSDLEAE